MFTALKYDKYDTKCHGGLLDFAIFYDFYNHFINTSVLILYICVGTCREYL